MPPTTPPGPQFDDLVRRLRARPVSAWRHADREEVCRATLQHLADLAAAAEGEPHRVVPDAGPSALADQLAVLVTDALGAGVEPHVVGAEVSRLRSALGLGG